LQRNSHWSFLLYELPLLGLHDPRNHFNDPPLSPFSLPSGSGEGCSSAPTFPVGGGHPEGKREEEEGESISTSAAATAPGSLKPPSLAAADPSRAAATSVERTARNNNDRWRNIQDPKDGEDEDEEEEENAEEYKGLSPLAEATESSNCSGSCSDEGGLAAAAAAARAASTLDSKLLHYFRSKANGQSTSPSVEKDGFDKRFDQLAKLHDLYASVSSISAKSQSRLEEVRATSACSLGDIADVQGSRSDVNSLCSEPVKLGGDDDNGGFLSLRRGGAAANEWLKEMDGKIPGGCSISLSDLGIELPGDVLRGSAGRNGFEEREESPLPPPPSNAELGGIAAGASVGHNRSDSPVLQGIDGELAKYAKLKDLETAYDAVSPCLPSPPPLSSVTMEAAAASSRRRDYVPDGASNPDLNRKARPPSSSPSDAAVNGGRGPLSPEADTSGRRGSSTSRPGFPKETPVAAQNATAGALPPPIPRRSPGTGQSSCTSSDPEEASVRKTHASPAKKGLPSSGSLPRGVGRGHPRAKEMSPSCRTATVGKARAPHHRLVRASRSAASGSDPLLAASSTPSSPRTKARGCPSGEGSDNPPTTPQVVIASSPRPSPSLASSSSNPLSASDPSSKTAPPLAPPPSSSSSSPKKAPRFSRLLSSATKKISRSPLKIVVGDKKKQRSSSSGLKNGSSSKPSSAALPSSSAPSSPAKNANGTPSSVRSNFGRGASAPAPARPRHSRGQAGGSRYPPTVLASPYAYPSSPAPRRSAGSRGETSSNDSGFAASTVRLRTTGNGGALGERGAEKTPGGGRRAGHCRSSGYESSAADSLESPTTKDVTQEELTLCRDLDRFPPAQVLPYGSERVRRLDGRWCSEETRRLGAEQRLLAGEMAAARRRLGAQGDRWPLDTHVGELVKSGMQADASVVEAMSRETAILARRVDACKSHVRLDTCFDAPSTAGKTCTTECDFAADILLDPRPDESELF